MTSLILEAAQGSYSRLGKKAGITPPTQPAWRLNWPQPLGHWRIHDELGKLRFTGKNFGANQGKKLTFIEPDWPGDVRSFWLGRQFRFAITLSPSRVKSGWTA
jgi:hypothetical protein